MWLWQALPSLPSVQVNNLGLRDLPVSIHFSVPVELNQVAMWTELEIFHPQVLKDCVWLPHWGLCLGFPCPSQSPRSPPRRLLLCLPRTHLCAALQRKQCPQSPAPTPTSRRIPCW